MTTRTPPAECHDADAPPGSTKRSRSALTRRGFNAGATGLAAAMQTNQITPAQKAASPFFPGFWDTHGWGLGIAVVTAPDDISPVPGRFGWWGGFGTTFCAHPLSGTVALLFSQRMMSSADDTAMSDEFLRLAFKQDGGQ